MFFKEYIDLTRSIIYFFRTDFKFDRFILFLKSVINRKNLSVFYFDEIENSNLKINIYRYSLIKNQKKSNNYFYDKELEIKNVSDINIEYQCFLINNAYVLPHINYIFTKKNCFLPSRETKIKGIDFFELHGYQKLHGILSGREFSLKFLNPKKCLIYGNILKEKSSIYEGINLTHALNNYWHFLIETAPKILLAKHLNIPSNIPLIIPKDLHPNLLEILHILNSKTGNREIIKVSSSLENPKSIKIAKLYNIQEHMNLPLHLPKSVDMSSCNFYFDKNPVLELITLIQDHFRIKPSMDKSIKLFLFRKETWRISKDQDKLFDFLTKKGYIIFDPGKMNLRDQIDICSKASSFIGFSGAGFTNSLFLPKDCKKIIFANSYYLPLLNVWDHLLENIHFIKNGNDYEFGSDDVHGTPYLTESNWKIINNLVSN